VISALLWRSTPYRLLDAMRTRPDVLPFSAVPLLTKLADYA